MGRRRHKEGIDELLGVTALNGVAWVGGYQIRHNTWGGVPVVQTTQQPVISMLR